MIQFKQGVDPASATAGVVPPGDEATVVRTFRKLNAVHLRFKLPEQTGVAAAAANQRVQTALARNQDVQFVERNYVYYAAQTPQQPAAAQSSTESHGLNDTDLGKLWYLDKIGAFRAWMLQKDSPNLVLAVIDTGVFRDHEDLVQADLGQQRRVEWPTWRG